MLYNLWSHFMQLTRTEFMQKNLTPLLHCSISKPELGTCYTINHTSYNYIWAIYVSFAQKKTEIVNEI